MRLLAWRCYSPSSASTTPTGPNGDIQPHRDGKGVESRETPAGVVVRGREWRWQTCKRGLKEINSNTTARPPEAVQSAIEGKLEEAEEVETDR